jgi:hypothetical protein
VRIAALLAASFTIIVGAMGLMSPDLLTAARRQYFAVPAEFYFAGVIHFCMGVVVILAASASRAPMTMRALGAVVCMQALIATLAGPERARAILELEVVEGPAVLRIGAMVALAAGIFVVFALRGTASTGKFGAKNS